MFGPAAGRAGCCRQTLLCVGSTPRVLATPGLPRSQVCAFPVYTAQAPACSIWSGPCVVCGSSPRVFHKNADLVAPAFCAFPARGLGCACVLCLPCPSGSGSQELDACTLPGCGAPSLIRGPSLSFHLCWWGVCALCLAVTFPADVNPPEPQEVFG